MSVTTTEEQIKLSLKGKACTFINFAYNKNVACKICLEIYRI